MKRPNIKADIINNQVIFGMSGNEKLVFTPM